MNADLKKAVEVLEKGGVIIFPTDTAYGIGCRIDDKRAVERLFKIRKRPKTQAVPVLVSSIEMAKEYLLPLEKEVEKLMRRFWPGGLTVVYPCQTKRVPLLVRGGERTLGIRMPDHKIPLALIKKLGVPMFLRSDGDIRSILDDIIAIGFDGWQAIQAPRMELH